jgi:DNA-binding transcriptional regulator YdaS (Cro superfamily)
MNPPLRLELSIDDQLLRVVRDRRTVRTFAVSTAERGAGFAEGSFQTPYGHFEIAGKIGEGMPIHTVFKGRKPIAVWSPDHPDDGDLILTRILRIRGLDPENSNTWQRYIYLHGTNHEESLGTPTSHGCVRMGNRDIIELFDMIPIQTPLFIHPPSMKTHPHKTARKRKSQKNLTLSVTSGRFHGYYPPAMSSKTKNTNKGKRYSPAEKKNILAYVEDFNKAKGRGGQKAAAEKFGVSQLTISAWKKALGAPAIKKATAKKPVKKATAKKATVKKATVKKAPAKKAVAKKPVKKADAKKVVAKKAIAKKNTNKGKRYSAAEKKEILDFVDSTNKKKGRGGQTAAAEKFGVAALTIAGWIKSAGKGAKKPAAKKVAKKPAVKKAKKAVAKKAKKAVAKKAATKKVKKAKKAMKKPTAKKTADVKKAIAALKSALAALNA